MRFFAATGVLLGTTVVAGCGGSKLYSASASVRCMRDQAALLLRPSRAAAVEARQRVQRVRVGFAVRSGSTIGLRARRGDYQLTLYPREQNLYLHFGKSNREAAALLRDYRKNYAYQLGEQTTQQLVYRRRNVVFEWDQQPSPKERKAIERCLLTKHRRGRLPRWRPAPQPTRFVSGAVSRRPPLLQLVPSDALAARSWTLAGGAGIGPEVAIEWQRTSLVSSPLDASGLLLWQGKRRSRVWHLAYSLRFPDTVSGAYVRTGDVNGDGHEDLLLFEDMDGSAGCGVYRLLASVRGRIEQLVDRHGCSDNFHVRIHAGTLETYLGIVKDPRTRNQIHCCWTTWLRTTMRWQGSHLTSVVKRRARQLPKAALASPYSW
jgi:hypothetical protein